MDKQDSEENENFTNVLESREIQLLLLIARSKRPIGARELLRGLDSSDKRLSESTVNRLLRHLDEYGLTESLDGRGRVLSGAGQVLARRFIRQERWNQQLDSMEIRTLSDVRDLLLARRGIEREVARSVALAATRADIQCLRDAMLVYGEQIDTDRRRLVTVDFHKVLTEMTPNSVLRSAATVLFDTRFDLFEQILDAITAGQGRTFQGPHEHEALVSAIEAHDPDAAESAMVAHIDRLLEDTSAEMTVSTRRTIERLLSEFAMRPDISIERENVP